MYAPGTGVRLAVHDVCVRVLDDAEGLVAVHCGKIEPQTDPSAVTDVVPYSAATEIVRLRRRPQRLDGHQIARHAARTPECLTAQRRDPRRLHQPSRDNLVALNTPTAAKTINAIADGHEQRRI